MDPANYDEQVKPYYTSVAEARHVSDKLRQFPNNFVYSGYNLYSDSMHDRGTGGYYWTSTTDSAYNAYYLSFYNSGVGPGTSSTNKFAARTIRCIKDSDR